MTSRFIQSCKLCAIWKTATLLITWYDYIDELKDRIYSCLNVNGGYADEEGALESKE